MDTFAFVFTAVASAAGMISAVFSAVSLHRTKKAQEETLEREKKSATICAFERLQAEALDDLVNFSLEDAKVLVECIDDEKCAEAYRDTKTLIARCEHFAVGVNSGVYDLGIVNKLGGEHLIHLYSKVEPIILYARQWNTGEAYYSEFEKMTGDLKSLRG